MLKLSFGLVSRRKHKINLNVLKNPSRCCHLPPKDNRESKDDFNSQKSSPKAAEQTSPTAPPSPMSQRKEMSSKVQRYGLSRYLHYVQGFERTLEQKFPSAMHLYRVFMVGIKEFYKDIKHFVRVARIASGQGFKGLTRKEIELYYQMPKDMLKVAPVLLISALPFANYVVFPVAYMFPRHFLSSHFWSLQQRAEFAINGLQRRLYNQRPVLRCLQSRLEDVHDPELFHKWRHIVGLLGSGVHPTTDEILGVKDLFSGEPFHLKSLYSNHVNGLLRLHGMHMGWRRRGRLLDRAFLLHEMDHAMAREGVHTMTQDELRWACFFRGLNPTNVKTEDLVSWLQNWTNVAEKVDRHCASLLLHCPVLLSYNAPSNWVLIY